MAAQTHRAKILARLLQRHEAASSGRPISLPFTRRYLPEYFDDKDPSSRDDMNAAAVSLEADKLVRIVWTRFHEGHEIRRVELKTDELERAYAESGRISRSEVVAKACSVIREISTGEGGSSAMKVENPSLHSSCEGASGKMHEAASSGWFQKACDEAAAAYSQDRSFHGLMPDELKKIRYLFHTLRMISGLKGESILKKRLSIAALGHSKAISSIEGPLAKILRCYADAEGGSEREILDSAGVVSRPDMTLISGDITFRKTYNMLLVKTLPYIGLPTASLSDLQVLDIGAEYLITIENEASFHEYVASVKGRYIAVFLSGYPNRGRIALLKGIHEYARRNNLDLPFYHWGDMDFGGLDIIRSYREKTGIHVIPHLMDPHMVETSPFSIRLDDSNRKRLEAFVSANRFNDLTETAKRLLDTGRRLEQESIEAEGV